MHYRYGQTAKKMEYGRFQQYASSKKTNLHFIVVGSNDNREVYV